MRRGWLDENAGDYDQDFGLKNQYQSMLLFQNAPNVYSDLVRGLRRERMVKIDKYHSSKAIPCKINGFIACTSWRKIFKIFIEHSSQEMHSTLISFSNLLKSLEEGSREEPIQKILENPLESFPWSRVLIVPILLQFCV